MSLPNYFRPLVFYAAEFGLKIPGAAGAELALSSNPVWTSPPKNPGQTAVPLAGRVARSARAGRSRSASNGARRAGTA